MTNMANNIGAGAYTPDALAFQQTCRIVYYSDTTKNTPYSAGVSQATQGIVIVTGDPKTYMTAIAIPKGDTRIFIYAKAGNYETPWKVLVG